MRKVFTLCVVLCITVNAVAAAPSENEVDDDDIVESKQGPVCISPACVQAAATILSNLDQTTEPCDDFYQFACGGFVKDRVIPEDKTTLNYFNIIGDRVVEQLRHILETPVEPNELRPFVLLKKFYNTCMNTTHIEEDGLQTIKGVLKKLGGWPVLAGSDWNGDQFDWKNTMYDSRKTGLSTNHLVSVFVGHDVTNSSKRIIGIDQASLGLEREYLVKGFDDSVVKAYYDYLVDLAVVFGADKASAAKEMKDAVEFEMRLAEITLAKEERRNVTLLTNLMTVKELQLRSPAIPWQDYLSNLMAVSGYTAQPNDVVDVGVPKFLTKLEVLLKETPKRVQANYLLNQVVLSSVPSLTKELQDRQLKFDAVQQGTQAKQARWKECTIAAATQLRLAADALYVRRYVSDHVKKSAEELVDNLKRAFMDMLRKVDWMDEGTRDEALQKAALMHPRIAYSPELRDDKKLEEYFAKLEPADTFLEFNFNIKKFSQDTSFKRLSELVSKVDWTENSFVCTVDAYYNVFENSIQLPAGILQGIFFDNERPQYLNYGSMGFAIGHEITHGFDDGGSQYDKEGNLRDWWAKETKGAFLKKVQCIIDQYSNETIPEINLKLNGINTQGENVADNGGIKEAYLAYSSWVDRHGEEARLPGLNYSPKQLFWISSANLWCQKQRDEYLRQRVLTNDHCPSRFRVTVPLSNSDEFAEDFNCPLGSKMNPENKCHVW